MSFQQKSLSYTLVTPAKLYIYLLCWFWWLTHFKADWKFEIYFFFLAFWKWNDWEFTLAVLLCVWWAVGSLGNLEAYEGFRMLSCTRWIIHKTYVDSMAQDEFLEVSKCLFQVSERCFCQKTDKNTFSEHKMERKKHMIEISPTL